MGSDYYNYLQARRPFKDFKDPIRDQSWKKNISARYNGIEGWSPHDMIRGGICCVVNKEASVR